MALRASTNAAANASAKDSARQNCAIEGRNGDGQLDDLVTPALRHGPAMYLADAVDHLAQIGTSLENKSGKQFKGAGHDDFRPDCAMESNSHSQ